MTIRPVGVGATTPDSISALLNEIVAAVTELQAPTKPVQMPTCTNANLPPADSWRGCFIFVSDKDCIAISTDVAGVYTWLRADGSAI